MQKLSARYLFLFSTALVWLILDQLTKYAVNLYLPLHFSLSIIPGCFNLVHILNRGAAFGFLNSSETDWQLWLFSFAAVAVLFVILRLAKDFTGSDKLYLFGLGSVAGGAIGNCIDRVSSHAVIDFFDCYIGTWHWPAFNIADIAICIGVAIVAFVLFFRSTPQK